MITALLAILMILLGLTRQTLWWSWARSPRAFVQGAVSSHPHHGTFTERCARFSCRFAYQCGVLLDVGGLH
jgi:hypothetical protein